MNRLVVRSVEEEKKVWICAKNSDSSTGVRRERKKEGEKRERVRALRKAWSGLRPAGAPGGVVTSQSGQRRRRAHRSAGSSSSCVNCSDSLSFVLSHITND